MELANETVDRLNVGIEEMIEDLRLSLANATLLHAKSDRILYQVEQNPSQFGFEETREACCGSGQFNGQGACGVGTFSLCTDVSNLIVFYALHELNF